jgi:serine/threonine protein kinase
VAVKTLPLRWLQASPSEFNSLHKSAIEFPWRDICMIKHLNKLECPYSIKLLGLFVDDCSVYVMTSLATGGDLFSWSAKLGVDPGPAREDLIRPLARQTFEGVRWLHDVGVSHRDLSLENVLLAEHDGQHLQIRIIDFGMSTFQSRRCRGVRGKKSYQAPEMHTASSYDGFLSDAFALGVMLFGMASAKYPWRSTVPGQCSAFILKRARGLSAVMQLGAFRNKGTGQPLAEATSTSFQMLLQGLLALDPCERTTLGESCYERRCTWDDDWWDLGENAAFDPVPTEG